VLPINELGFSGEYWGALIMGAVAEGSLVGLFPGFGMSKSRERFLGPIVRGFFRGGELRLLRWFWAGFKRVIYSNPIQYGLGRGLVLNDWGGFEGRILLLDG